MNVQVVCDVNVTTDIFFEHQHSFNEVERNSLLYHQEQLYIYYNAYLHKHLYVYMIICVGASRMGACEIICLTAKSQHLLSSLVSSTTYFLRQGFSLNLKLIVLVRLTGQKTPWIFLSLPSQPWDYRCTQPFLPFYVDSRDLNSDHHAFMTNTT